jgi:hypothetical protein
MIHATTKFQPEQSSVFGLRSQNGGEKLHGEVPCDQVENDNPGLPNTFAYYMRFRCNWQHHRE